jgi:hypothetical protein
MAIKPIVRYGKFTPTGVDRSGEIRMRALAGLGEEVYDITRDVVKTKREQEAAVEGQKAGQEAALEGKDVELRSGFKFGDAQFNQAVSKAYTYESYTKIQDHINEAQINNPDSVQGYENELNAKIQGLFDATPEAFKGDLQAYYRRANSSTRNKVQSGELKRINADNIAKFNSGNETLATSITNSARALDFDGLDELLTEYNNGLDGAYESRLITAQEREVKKANIKDQVAIQLKMGEVDNSIFDETISLKDRAERGLLLVDALRENPDQELTAKQNDALLKTLEVKVNGVVSEYNQSVKVSDAELRKNNGIANVTARATGELPVTTDVITDKDIDNHYNVQRLNFNVEPELRMDDQINYATTVNSVPKTMKTEILSELRSNDPDRVVVAAQSIMELNALQGMPEAFSGQDLIYADALYRNMEFYEFDEALKRATDIAFPSSSTQKSMMEARKSELSADTVKRNKMYADKLEDAFETGVFGFGTQFTPNNIERDAMIADLRTLTEDNYLLGFETFDAALQHSVRKMQNSYKTSEFGFLQHAPEEYYGLGKTKDTSWIRQSLHEELIAKYGDGFEPDDIILLSDTETSTMAKKRMPTYQAFIRMPNGSLQPVDERVNPSLDYPAVLEKYNADIEEKAQVPILNKRQFLTEHRMTPEQNAKAREILQGSTNPFALIGKAIGGIDEVPEFIAKFFEGAQNELRQSREIAQEQSREVQEAMFNWNEQYIARLQKASGKQEIDLTVADLSN